MKRFEFRLESVLNLSRYELDRAEAGLVEQEELLRREQLVLRDIQAEKRRLRIQRRDFQKVLDFTMMEIVSRCEEGVDFRITTQELKLVDIHKELTRRRRELKDARQKHRMYEKLKEKALEEHKRERQHYEQAFLDEISVMAASRKEIKI